MPRLGFRERLFQSGEKALTDMELLCILLRTGSAGNPVPSLASNLLETFGDLRGVLSASPAALKEVEGLGPSKIAMLLSVREMARRIFSEQRMGGVIGSVGAAYQLFSDIALETQEMVYAAFLTPQLRLIRREKIFQGTLDHCQAQAREIIKEALKWNAARVLIAHNHPSQDPTPSGEDIKFTQELFGALKLLNIQLVDHLIICTGENFFSFAQSRQLPWGDFENEREDDFLKAGDHILSPKSNE